VVGWSLGLPRIEKSLPLQDVPDVVMHDERRQRLYVATGSPGVVMVFDTGSLDEFQTVQPEEGAHAIGRDPASAQLYTFAPQRGGALVFTDT
jgi:hypothetical protein